MNATGLMGMQNILASVVTVFVALFSYFLQVPMPILTWRAEF